MILLAGAGSLSKGEGNLETMLTAALDGIIDLAGAEKGLMILFDTDGEVLFERARSHRHENLAPPHLPVRGLLLERIRRGLFGEGTASAEALDAPLLRHLLVASLPIHCGGRLCGLVYLEHSGAALTRKALELAQNLAQLGAVAASRGSSGRWRWRTIDASRWYTQRWACN